LPIGVSSLSGVEIVLVVDNGMAAGIVCAFAVVMLSAPVKEIAVKAKCNVRFIFSPIAFGVTACFTSSNPSGFQVL
jgi:hypothetical protein